MATFHDYNKSANDSSQADLNNSLKYKRLYIKYKTKYTNLKNQMDGGAPGSWGWPALPKSFSTKSPDSPTSPTSKSNSSMLYSAAASAASRLRPKTKEELEIAAIKAMQKGREESRAKATKQAEDDYAAAQKNNLKISKYKAEIMHSSNYLKEADKSIKTFNEINRKPLSNISELDDMISSLKKELLDLEKIKHTKSIINEEYNHCNTDKEEIKKLNPEIDITGEEYNCFDKTLRPK